MSLCTSMVIFMTIFLATSTAFVEQDWNQFKATFGKTYEDSSEEANRRQIFTSNLEYIMDHNLLHEEGLSTFTMGTNNFSDWTTDEFFSFLSFKNPPSLSQLSYDVTTGDQIKTTPDSLDWREHGIVTGMKTAPDSLDWREHGVVTGVKDQGMCGGAVLFAELAAVESVWAKETGNLVDLALYQLIDCGLGGCSGGRLTSAYQTIIDMGGIMSAEDYPVPSAQCSYDDDLAVAHISSIGTVTPLDEEEMVETLYQQGPMSIGISACRSFQHYHAGVYDDPSCGDGATVNHDLLLVGYDKAGPEETDYWIARNSWGTGWGQGGYVKLRMWTNTANLATFVYYPIV